MADVTLDLLLEVLQKVQTDVAGFRAEMTDFRVEVGVFRTDVDRFRADMNGLRVQMNDRLEALEDGARQESEFMSNMLSRMMVAIQKLSPEQENSDRLNRLEQELDGLKSRISAIEL